MILNEKGLSLPEIVIALGLMAVVGIGVGALVTQTTKKQTEMDHRLERMTLEKMVENYYYSDDGCDSLINKAVGDIITLDPKKINPIAGKTEISELRVTGFTPSTDNGIHGIAKLELKLKEKIAPSAPTKTYIREIPVPVNVKLEAGRHVIKDCRLNKDQTFQAIVKKVCEGTFGSITLGMSCADAIAEVESRIIKEICVDIYGEKGVVLNSIHCNMKQIHANKSCGANEVIYGFDEKGNVKCRPVPTIEDGGCSVWSAWLPDPADHCTTETITQKQTCLDAGSTEEVTRHVQGEKTCAITCNTWSAWTPSASLSCQDTDVFQTQTCLDGGTPSSRTQIAKGESQGPGCCDIWTPAESGFCSTDDVAQVNNCGGTRTIKGTQTCDSNDCIWLRPGSWGLTNGPTGSYECAEYPIGGASALESGQTPVKNGERLRVDGNFCIGGSCHGHQVLECKDGNFITIESVCIPGVVN